jgi:hypothetical protein
LTPFFSHQFFLFSWEKAVNRHYFLMTKTKQQKKRQKRREKNAHDEYINFGHWS